MSRSKVKGWPAVAAGLLLLATATLALPGCGHAPAQSAGEAKPTGVTVVKPVEMDVTDYEEFTGRADAANKVGVQAMVTGYLDDIKFKDGDDVVKDQILFEIDPKTFKAKRDKSEASVLQAKALYNRLKDEFERNKRLVPHAMSMQDFVKLEADLLEAEASVGQNLAQLEQDTVNLEYTSIKSKITGRVSRRLIDRGNMVKANETMLTWIYQIDPMYGYFDVDERTVIKLRKLINGGSIKSYRDDTIEVGVGLADEEGYSLKGHIDWVDNVLDAGTGTLKIRCVINQPKDKSGNPMVLISPGLFVRVKLPTSTPRKTLLIAEKAIGTDQGEKFVFVVNDKNEIERRNVTLGQIQGVTIGNMRYNLRVVEKNSSAQGKELLATDRVVVSGLQRVKEGSKVSPSLLETLPGGVSVRAAP
jgi:RND family efflux transporter MFP subunit